MKYFCSYFRYFKISVPIPSFVNNSNNEGGIEESIICAFLTPF